MYTPMQYNIVREGHQIPKSIILHPFLLRQALSLNLELACQAAVIFSQTTTSPVLVLQESAAMVSFYMGSWDPCKFRFSCFCTKQSYPLIFLEPSFISITKSRSMLKDIGSGKNFLNRALVAHKAKQNQNKQISRA